MTEIKPTTDQLRSSERKTSHHKYAGLLLFLILIALLSEREGVGSVQILEDNEITNPICLVTSEEVPDEILNFDIMVFLDVINKTISVSCHSVDTSQGIPEINRDPQITLVGEVVQIPADNPYLIADADIKVAWLINDIKATYTTFEYMENHPLTTNLAVNCHSFVMQFLQNQFGFDIGVTVQDWDNVSILPQFLGKFGAVVERIKVEEQISYEELELQVGDALLFYGPDSLSFEEEDEIPTALLHSGVVTSINPETGDMILANKFGHAGVVFTANNGYLDVAKYYRAENIVIYRLHDDSALAALPNTTYNN